MALTDLRQYGQSVWYDFMSRHLLASGELLRLIADDGLGGVTSNPTILEAAVNKSTAYDGEIAILARRGMRSEEHTSELQSLAYLVCRLLLEKKNRMRERRSSSLSARRTGPAW